MPGVLPNYKELGPGEADLVPMLAEDFVTLPLREGLPDVQQLTGPLVGDFLQKYPVDKAEDDGRGADSES